jgi:uncharacterized protein YggE
MNKNLTNRSLAIALAAVLALAGGVAIASSSKPKSSKDYITVSATGKVKVTPDAVRLNATISVVAGTSKQALAAASTSASAVRAALVANGVVTKDIATENLTVYPEYNYSQNKSPVIIGYRGNQGFDVVIHNAKNAGEVVDAVVAAGGNNVQISSVAPFVFDSTKATSIARAEAVKNAKAKADSYASLLDVKLGKVKYLVESSSPTPYPMEMFDGVASAGARATKVDLGQQDVTVSIKVQWSLS